LRCGRCTSPGDTAFQAAYADLSSDKERFRIQIPDRTASRFIENPDELRTVGDQVPTVCTFYILNFVLFDVN